MAESDGNPSFRVHSLIRDFGPASFLLEQSSTMNSNKSKKSWVGVPPWVIIGAVVILAPIFAFITVQSIDQQKRSTTALLVEKGAALIRSFEAGARTGMIGMRWGGNQVQKLLSETAQQPDIAYILVTNTNGIILADSNVRDIGAMYKTGLDLQQVALSPELRWRQITGEDHARIFEVFRRFTPIRNGGARQGMHMQGNDWCSPHMAQQDSSNGEASLSRQIIFVGLKMGAVEEARKEDTRKSVFMAATLLLICFAGVIALFLAQAYRSTKASLSRVKAFSDNLVENMPMGLLAIDRDDRIASFNQTAEAVLELSADKILGSKAGEVLSKPLSNFLLRLKGQEGLIESEFECPVNGGKTVPLEVIGTVLKDEAGVSLGWIILFRDLTEIQHLKSEVARSRHLASIGTLAAGVAHEIRNPLSSIKGFATYFKERYRNVPEDLSTAEIMIQEVERLNRVIGQLLEFAKPMTVQKEPVSLERVIKHSLKLIEGDARTRGVEILFHNDAVTREAWIDTDRITQVLLNLYLNAIESMDRKGVLTVGLDLDENSDRFRITVSDTGKGIPEKDLPNLFDPYFTTKSSGTGLGLAIVHKILESHGGEIRVDTAPETGTTITVLLPAGKKGLNRMERKNSILVVDDDHAHRTMLKTLLGGWGYRIEEADDGGAAIEKVKERPFDLILMDIRMVKISGLEALSEIKSYNPAIPIIIMTAYSSVETAVEALKNGAYDYLTKPLDFEELHLILDRAMDHRMLKEENRVLKETLGKKFDTGNIIGRSNVMVSLLESVAQVAPSEASVLITGESGTGKELIAGAIHFNSHRKEGPFIKVNCAAITESLLESELFGHEKGAFTGAHRQKDGKFQQANGGSIFLDEVSEMPLSMQVKLLRVLQERELVRVGGEETITVDVRVIAATNKPLMKEIEEGRFREDLYYRLNVIALNVPALRDRREDIPLLANRFLTLFAEKNKKPVKGFSPQAMDSMLQYRWPGNVRELMNAVERSVVMSRHEYIDLEELPLEIKEGPT